MISKEMIDRINALSQKQRQCGLNEEEKIEQADLRRQYLDSIKEQVRSQLGAAQVPEKHPVRCACGCHGAHKH
jgi:uncharacterized protein YnzC (UPF0291/DUF896 family)